MAVRVIQCGEPANASERIAIERCREILNSRNDPFGWVVLSNLVSSASDDFQSDELDLVCIGPPGVALVEVKHWDAAWIARNQSLAENEGDKVTAKAKRLAGRIRRALPSLDCWVAQYLLLTRSGDSSTHRAIRGVPVFNLASLPKLFSEMQSPGQSQAMDTGIIEAIATLLEPRAKLQLDGRVRTLGEYINLELISSPQNRFHRVYRGIHHRSKERVIVHLYDLSASEERDPRLLAEREFETIRAIQKSAFVPRVRDYPRDVPNYPGELLYGALYDSCAPTLERRAKDRSWTPEARIEFAARAIEGLAELHEIPMKQGAFVHRNISPTTLLVGTNEQPLFTDFSLARLPTHETIFEQGSNAPQDPWVAPEIRSGGFSTASQASDLFALCETLKMLFGDTNDDRCLKCLAILEGGSAEDPKDRDLLLVLAEKLRKILGDPIADSPVLAPDEVESDVAAVEFWCEGTEVPYGKSDVLKVVSKLGSGGVGHTFKVERLNGTKEESYGTFVAKVIREPHIAEHLIGAYKRIQSLSDKTGLATVFEVTPELRPNAVFALLKWVEGDSLDTVGGRLQAEAERSIEDSVHAVLRRWLRESCCALKVLHERRLVHGDVSPKNLIVSGGGVCLIDYDLVSQEGRTIEGSGALPYCSPEAQRNEPLMASDDIYALAASLFEVAFGDPPFPSTTGAYEKVAGLAWTPEKREALADLVPFFERATHPTRSERFANAIEVLAWLEGAQAECEPIERSENVAPWLDELLRVYPGSVHGNIETRGLDSEFAEATYVPTDIEDALYAEIKNRKVSLVILCGNAGDGKTALIQTLGKKFGVPATSSATRIWECRTDDGLYLKANLDGAAAWQGRSANELLDEFFEPFLDGPPGDERAHLLAINDGRLLEWLGLKRHAEEDRPLIRALLSCLAHDDDPSSVQPYVRFVSLNHRSLVGGVDAAHQRIETGFLDRLVYSLLGREQAEEKWASCGTCLAYDRCTAGRNAHRLVASFREEDIEEPSEEARRGKRTRERLAEALQAVHQRGEVHITTRELRGAISYILFGTTSCQGLHENPELVPPDYYDMAFNPAAPARQGELLRELTELDPALEAHPLLDRWLVGRSGRSIHGAGPPYPGTHLASARRRAYFEWLPEEVDAVTRSESALSLAHGKHIDLFRQASLKDANANQDLCRRVCRGISMLEELPMQAMLADNRVQLRIPSRNPTETIFWIEKPLERFRLEPEWPPPGSRGFPVLPNRLRLIYAFADGMEETLSMGYALFHTLLNLSEGEQLTDRRSDDIFANLQIFVQRLSLEDERQWFAWHPRSDEEVLRLGVRSENRNQILFIGPREETQREQ